jgi:hypothetical protein
MRKVYIKPSRHPPLQKRNFRGWLGNFLTSISSILSIASVFYALSPKLDIRPSITFNINNPLETPFEVKNNSLFSVKSITLTSKVRKIETMNNSSVTGGRWEVITTPVPNLEPDESTTLTLPFPKIINFTAPISNADIEIIITYRPLLLPYSLNKAFHFVTIKGYDNILHWSPKALSE